MDSYMFLPLIFKGAGMRCLIIGGGDVAWRKVELLLTAGCAVTVIAPHIHNSIRSAVDTQSVRWVAREFQSGDCRGYQLVVAATERREVNQAIHDESMFLCIPVNVVDDPELCSVIFPAIWQQDPLTISVSTGGGAPFMAAAVRDRIAAQGAPLARWTGIATQFRSAVRSEIADRNEKNALYRQFVDAFRPGNPPDPPESKTLGDWLAWLDKLNRRV
jgi:uroporphyrin-III C-methyltransferase / precorrin-2 dehydrogenase / sirohydrochlorin ferrochelatase